MALTQPHARLSSKKWTQRQIRRFPKFAKRSERMWKSPPRSERPKLKMRRQSKDAVAPAAGDAQISAQGSTNTASQMNVIAGIARSVVGFLVPCLPFIHRLVARITSIRRAARILAKGAMSIHRSKVIAKQREIVGGWIDWV